MCPVIKRVCERDMAMAISDLLLPPKAEGKTKRKKRSAAFKSANGANGSLESEADLELEVEPEDDRETERRERQCDCSDEDQETCTHFLTYDLFDCYE